MPGWIVVAIILVVIAIIVKIGQSVAASAARKYAKSYEERHKSQPPLKDGRYLSDYGALVRTRDVLMWIGRSLWGFVALILILSSITIVGTKEIGVVTTFGKPSGSLSNGIHVKWPWQKVTELDAAIQTDSRVDDQKVVHCTSTSVRLANQSTACVDNSIRWRIKQSAADALFKDYRTFDNIRDSLVTRELNAALNSVMSRYNPLETLISGDQINTSLGTLADRVQAVLRGQISDQIEVLSVIIPFVGYDPQTQAKINLFQAALADTKIAKQREQTALNEARANQNLAGSVSHDPNVLVSKCLDELDAMVKAGQAVPPGFSCWPNGQSALVVPATR